MLDTHHTISLIKGGFQLLMRAKHGTTAWGCAVDHHTVGRHTAVVEVAWLTTMHD